MEDRLPAEKVHPALWEAAVAGKPEKLLPVIILLRTPDLDGIVAPERSDADTLRVRAVAAIAHAFAPEARAAGLEDLRALSHLPIAFGRIRPADLARLAENQYIASIEPDRVYQQTRIQGGALMNATTLRNSFGGSGAGAEVAIIDSGVFQHTEFSGRYRVQGDFTGTTGDGTIDGTGHGTACAGIVLGSNGGMAPQAGLWSMKVFDGAGHSQQSWILAALNAAYASRNDFGGLDVVNMSLGLQGFRTNSNCDASFPADAAAINSLVSVGIPVFVASGNDGYLDGVSEPACLSNAIAVGAVYDGNLPGRTYSPPVAAYPSGTCTDGAPVTDQITCYSNSGNPLDILAPSHDCTTTQPGNTYTSSFGGTSAAAPYAAGVAAQILSLRPSTTPAQLRNGLMTTGRPITDVNSITRNRIDAVQAYQALSGGGGDTSPCVRNTNTACLWGGRIEVRVDYNFAPANPPAGAADILYLGLERGETDVSSFWWFFDPANFEMGVKINPACDYTGNIWIYISGLTNAGYTVRLRDSVTGNTKTYSNPEGNYPQTIGDTGQGLPCF